MSLQSYDVCGHCNQILSEKALKEHRRLYYDERSRVWITVDKSAVSPASSPFCLSPPGSTAASDNHSEVDSQLQDIMLSQSSCGHPFEENLMDQENLMSSKLISPPFDSAIYRYYFKILCIINNYNYGHAGDVEYWNEDDLDFEHDFLVDSDCEPPTPLLDITSQDESLNREEQAVIWWVVAFTCVFETLHSVSSRAIGWLLHLLGSLLHCLGHYSQQIARIARAFPCTLHQRSKYLEKKNVSFIRSSICCLP